MDMMSSIAAQSMSMKAAEFQQNYAVSLTKNAMETQEIAVQEILELMPETPAKGQYIDVYA